MLDPCNSFLDSEQDVGVEIQEDAVGDVNDFIDGDLDVSGTLFASLFTDISNTETTNTVSDIMSSTSDDETDDILSYLSRTQGNLMKDVNEPQPQETVQRKKTRSSVKAVLSEKSKSNANTSNQSVYSRPPLMCSSTVNTKSSKVEAGKLDLQTESKVGSNKSDKCMNKSAIIARENREKKKKYVQQLEINYENMKVLNFDLQSKLAKKSKLCDSLQKEIQYLRNVLANQSGISALLKNIHSTQGLSFTSSIELSDENKSINPKKRQLDENDNYDNQSKGVYVRATGSNKKSKQDSVHAVSEDYSPPLTPISSPEEVVGGVCLHVSNNKVSLELCSKCAENASNAWNKAAMLDVAVNEKTVNKGTKL